MKYLITEIKGIYDAKDNQKRISFRVQDYDHNVSGFFAQPIPKVGEEIEGDIVPKDGVTKTGQPTTYHNFYPPKGNKAPVKMQYTQAKRPEGVASENDTLINRKLDAIWTELKVIKGRLPERTSDGSEMPAF